MADTTQRNQAIDAKRAFSEKRREQSEQYRRARAGEDILERLDRDQGSHRGAETEVWKARKAEAVRWFIDNGEIPAGVGKRADIKRFAVEALIAMGLSPAEADARAEGIDTPDKAAAMVEIVKTERAYQPQPAAPTAEEAREAEFQSAITARILAETMSKRAEGIGQGMKELQDHILDTIANGGANDADPARRNRMRQLFETRTHISNAIKEFYATAAATLQDARNERELDIAIRSAEEISAMNMAEESIADRIRTLASKSLDPVRADKKDISPWDNPTEALGTLFADIFGHDRVKNAIIHIREHRRKMAIEHALIGHLATLDAVLVRQQAILDSELTLIRRERELDEAQAARPTSKEAEPETLSRGAQLLQERIAERRKELDDDRTRLIANYRDNRANEQRPGGPDAPNPGDAAAWAILRDPETRALAREQGLNEAELREAATRFAAASAKEKKKAPSDLILDGFIAAEREAWAIEREVAARSAAGQPPDPARTERLDHLRSQSAEYLRAFMAARAEFGGDGITTAARERAAIRGESIEAARDALTRMASETPRERDTTKDAIANAAQAHETLVPRRLSLSAFETELTRQGRESQRKRDNSPRPGSLIKHFHDREAELARWKGLAASDTPFGRWAAFKAGAIERELDALAARMAADPDVRSYAFSVERSGAPVHRNLVDRMDKRAARHEEGIGIESRILPEERLFAGWQVIDRARESLDAAMADPALSSIPADLRAGIHKERAALEDQAMQHAAALTKSPWLDELVDGATIGKGDGAAQALRDRIQTDARAFEAKAPERAEADVARLMTPEKPELRGRTNDHAADNISTLLSKGEVRHGTIGHFTVSSRDAEERADEAFGDELTRNPFPRSRPLDKEPSKEPERKETGREDAKEQDQPKDISKGKDEPERDFREEREALRRRQRIERLAAEAVERDLRAARMVHEKLDATHRTVSLGHSPAALVWHGSRRAFDKSMNLGRDLRTAVKERDKDGSFIGAVRKSWKDIQRARATTHVKTFEALVKKMANSQLTPAEMRTLKTYGQSSELRHELDKGERLLGRKPRLSEFARRATNPDKQAARLTQMAPDIIAEIDTTNFVRQMDKRAKEYRGKDEHLLSGRNFEEGYRPTKEDIQLARAINENPTALRKLLDGKEKLDKLREKHPGKSDEELFKMRFGKGRAAREGLEAERVWKLMEGMLAKEREGAIRKENEPMSVHLAGRSRDDEREAAVLDGNGTKRQAKKEEADRFPSRDERAKMAKDGRVPSYGAMARDRKSRQAALDIESGRDGTFERGRERG